MHTMLALLCLLVAWPALVTAEPVLHVTYARDLSSDDSRMEYPLRVLALALQKSGAAHVISPSDRPLPQGAAVARIANGKGVNLMWSMTSEEREAQLLPVRIPIDKGLFGYRIGFIRQENKDLLAAVTHTKDLSAITIGQGHDWPDTHILQSNGLQVATSTTGNGLLTMLRGGRFDYFPRSVLEIWEEVAPAARQRLMVDEHLLLHYPTAVYFFVNKKETALAEALDTGLRKAIADGSFDATFYEFFGSVIKRAKLRERVTIRLHNPSLPAATPLADKRLWFTPKDLPRE